MTQDQNTQSKVSDDKWLQRLMKAGAPLAGISIVSLILGQLMSNVLLGQLFIVTATLALIIGFIYNMRFVTLSVRKKRTTPPNS